METLICDFWFFPAFFLVFTVEYIFGLCVVFRNWSPKQQPVAASCFISLAHGTPAAILALSAILARPEPGFASENTHFQNLVLDFSIAYFVVDLLHYLIFIPSDYLFIAHHLATLFVFLTCRYLVYHGAYALLVLLFLAEITSACQNIWTLAGIRKAESPVAARIRSSLDLPFLAFYSVARGFAGTTFFYKMTAFYLSGRASNVIPWWMSLSWIVVVGGAIAVSILWVLSNWVELYRERCGTGDKKKR